MKVKLYSDRPTGMLNRDSDDFGPHLIIAWHEYMKPPVDRFVSIGAFDWYLNKENGFPYMKIIQTFDENHFLALGKDKLPYVTYHSLVRMFKALDTLTRNPTHAQIHNLRQVRSQNIQNRGRMQRSDKAGR